MPDLMGDQSEEVQRIRMPGLDREDLAVKPLRLVDSSCLLVLDGQIKGLLEGHFGHGGVSVRAHQSRHILRYADSMSRAKLVVSMRVEFFMVSCKVVRI